MNLTHPAFNELGNLDMVIHKRLIKKGLLEEIMVIAGFVPIEFFGEAFDFYSIKTI